MDSSQALTIKCFVEEGLGIAPFSSKLASCLLSHKTCIVKISPEIKRVTGWQLQKNNNLLIIKTFKDFILKSMKI
jgi:hypothetical protein